MGSTVMHICLTKKILNKLKIHKEKDEELSEIYVGSVLPDFSQIHKKTKDESHYIIEIENGKIKNRIPDLSLFLKVHGQEILKDNYLLGELIHIVSDRVWYSEYATKYADYVSDDGKTIFDFRQNKYIPHTEFQRKIYGDYTNINKYLLVKYKIDLDRILEYEKSEDVCKEIRKKSGIEDNTNLLITRNVFDKLNYVKEKDITDWIRSSEKEILEIISKLKKIDKKGKSKNMKVIVGLGNIGKEYERTRHNAGFIAVNELSEKYGITAVKKMKKSTCLEGNINGNKVVIAKPNTFMNLSGSAIVEIKNWYKIENEDILVIYDDIDLEFGDIRYREEGSAGTHNGMKDILANLKTNQLSRIRIGIENRKGLPILLADYVLSNFTKDEFNMLKTDILTKIDEKVLEFLDK